MSSAAPADVLLQEIQFAVEETPRGTWRRFVYPNGAMFAEYKSHRRWRDQPLVHITIGRSPETGRFVAARGVIAIGRYARGIVAIGQFALGVVAIGQVAFGLLFGFGQVSTGLVGVGQATLGVVFAAGQLALGHIAIGQVAYGHYVLAQLGWGDFVVDMRGVNPAAKRFFLSLIGR